MKIRFPPHHRHPFLSMGLLQSTSSTFKLKIRQKEKKNKEKGKKCSRFWNHHPTTVISTILIIVRDSVPKALWNIVPKWFLLKMKDPVFIFFLFSFACVSLVPTHSFQLRQMIQMYYYFIYSPNHLCTSISLHLQG